MIRHINKITQWMEAFDDVIEKYQAVKSYIGSPGAMNTVRHGEQMGGSGERNPLIVRPLAMDFIADVEIAARRALSTVEEKGFFRAHYANIASPRIEILTNAAEQLMSSQRAAYEIHNAPEGELNDTVRQKVGKMFMARGIYPVGYYMCAKDVRK